MSDDTQLTQRQQKLILVWLVIGSAVGVIVAVLWWKLSYLSLGIGGGIACGLGLSYLDDRRNRRHS